MLAARSGQKGKPRSTTRGQRTIEVCGQSPVIRVTRRCCSTHSPSQALTCQIVSCAPGLAVKLGARKFSRAKRLLGSNDGKPRVKTSKLDSQMPPEEGKMAAEETMTGGGTGDTCCCCCTFHLISQPNSAHLCGCQGCIHVKVADCAINVHVPG